QQKIYTLVVVARFITTGCGSSVTGGAFPRHRRSRAGRPAGRAAALHEAECRHAERRAQRIGEPYPAENRETLAHRRVLVAAAPCQAFGETQNIAGDEGRVDREAEARADGILNAH